MGNPRCEWVHDRLPLLAGGELLVSDRRRVERHLIGCPKCRQHRDALARTFAVLHAASAAPGSARPDAPSLWPALQRQIRQSRRPVPTAGFAWPRFAFSPAFAFGLGLLAAIGIAVAVAVRNPAVDAPTRIAANTRPIAAPPLATIPSPPTEVPDPGHDAARPSSDAPAPETTVPATRLGYDLDHGMPMGSETREGKQSTY